MAGSHANSFEKRRGSSTGSPRPRLALASDSPRAAGAREAAAARSTAGVGSTSRHARARRWHPACHATPALPMSEQRSTALAEEPLAARASPRRSVGRCARCLVRLARRTGPRRSLWNGGAGQPDDPIRRSFHLTSDPVPRGRPLRLAPFGEALRIAGGTLGQLLHAAACAVSLHRRGDNFWCRDLPRPGWRRAGWMHRCMPTTPPIRCCR